MHDTQKIGPRAFALLGLLIPIQLAAATAPSLKGALQFTPGTERPVFDRKQRDFVVTGFIRNTSTEPVVAPISLVLTGLTPNRNSLELETVHGHLANGDPYVVLADSGKLEPDAELPVSIRFKLGNDINRIASATLEKLASHRFRNYAPAALAGFTFSYDLVRVPAGNHSPVADAGPDWTTIPEALVTLDGSQSHDDDGNVLSYRWTLIERPPLSQRDITDQSAEATELNPDVVGQYVATLVTNDGYEDSLPDSVTVTVNADGVTRQNRPPVITSTAVTTARGTKPYVYQVTASDPDGDPALTYTLISSPAGMSIDANGSLQWTPPQPHHDGMQYAVVIEVSDGHGGAVRQSFSIAVSICTCA